MFAWVAFVCSRREKRSGVVKGHPGAMQEIPRARDVGEGVGGVGVEEFAAVGSARVSLGRFRGDAAWGRGRCGWAVGEVCWLSKC